MNWSTSSNSKTLENEQLVVDFVDPWLTSIYQPLDVGMNVPRKRLIRRQHHDHVHHILQVDARSSKFKLGNNVTIPRATLIDFVEKVYGDVKSENIKK